MSKRRLVSVLAAAALTATAIPAASALQDGNGRTRAGTDRGVQLPAMTDATLISLNFPGGTLTEYAAAVTKAAEPTAANILLRGETDSINIGPVLFGEVGIASALEAVTGTYEIGNNAYHVSSRGIEAREGRPVFSVQVEGSGNLRRSPGAVADSQDILVLQIKELTTALPGDPPESGVAAETVLTAIEAALAIAGNTENTQVKYHAPSGLVMLAGPASAREAADEVLKQMSRDVSERRSRARNMQESRGLGNPVAIYNQLADAEAELQKQEVRHNVSAQRLHIAMTNLNESENLKAEGLVSASEINKLSLQVAEAQAQVEQDRIEIDRQRRRVEQFAAAFERAKELESGGNPSDEVAALREENAMLRDRLAMMDAQIADLRAKMNEQTRGNQPSRNGTNRGGR